MTAGQAEEGATPVFRPPRPWKRVVTVYDIMLSDVMPDESNMMLRDITPDEYNMMLRHVTPGDDGGADGGGAAGGRGQLCDGEHGPAAGQPLD